MEEAGGNCRIEARVDNGRTYLEMAVYRGEKVVGTHRWTNGHQGSEDRGGFDIINFPTIRISSTQHTILLIKSPLWPYHLPPLALQAGPSPKRPASSCLL